MGPATSAAVPGIIAQSHGHGSATAITTGNVDLLVFLVVGLLAGDGLGPVSEREEGRVGRLEALSTRGRLVETAGEPAESDDTDPGFERVSSGQVHTRCIGSLHKNTIILSSYFINSGQIVNVCD